MVQPGRTFSSPSYRYGFNGYEKDDEVKGLGNSIDFGARIYDSRIGRFLSLDPRSREFSFMSPYCFAANNPIYFVDKDGKGPLHPKTGIRVELGISDFESMWFFSVGKPTKDIHGITDPGLATSAKFYNSYYNIFYDFINNPDITDGTEWEWNALAQYDGSKIPKFSNPLYSTFSYPTSELTSKSLVSSAAKTGNYIFTTNKYGFERGFFGIKKQYKIHTIYKVENNIVVEELIFKLKKNSDRKFGTSTRTTYDISNYSAKYHMEKGSDGTMSRVKTVTYDVEEHVEAYDENGELTSTKNLSYSKEIVTKLVLDRE